MIILKKIAKKCRFLRFLNKKITKLSVLGISLIGLCVSSGVSFAKFRSANYGGGAGSIAQLGTAKFSYDSTNVEILGDLNIGLYAFIASFNVQYSPSEVERNVTIDLKLSTDAKAGYNSTDPSTIPTITGFGIIDGKEDTATKDTVFESELNTLDTVEYTNSNGQTETKSELRDNISLKQLVYGNTLPTVTDDDLSILYYDRVYYAHSTDGTNYDWVNKELTSLHGFQLTKNEKISKSEETHYFKVIFFIYLELDESGFITENTSILYNVNMIQE